MKDQDILKRVAELDSAATPAPWTVRPASGDFSASESALLDSRGRNLLFASDNGKHGQAENRNALFMAESRELLPLLGRRLTVAVEWETARNNLRITDIGATGTESQLRTAFGAIDGYLKFLESQHASTSENPGKYSDIERDHSQVRGEVATMIRHIMESWSPPD